MILCPSCDEVNDDKSGYCSNCGKSLAGHMSSRPKSHSPQRSIGSSSASEVSDRKQSQGYVPVDENYPEMPPYGRNDVSGLESPYERRYYQPPGRGYRGDEINPAAYLCAFCLWPAGIVLYLMLKDDKPKSAKTVAYASLLGFIFSFMLAIL